MVNIAIILGANQKAPLQVVESAIRLIEWNIGKLIGASQNYKTPPWGYESSNPYLNKVIKVETLLDPAQIMTTLLNIEKSLGRKRNNESGYADRMIDLDILTIDSEIINTDLLKVPHPKLQDRKFCLIPLMEVDEDWMHPRFQLSVKEMLNICKDDGEIKIWENL